MKRDKEKENHGTGLSWHKAEQTQLPHNPGIIASILLALKAAPRRIIGTGLPIVH